MSYFLELKITCFLSERAFVFNLARAARCENLGAALVGLDNNLAPCARASLLGAKKKKKFSVALLADVAANFNQKKG